MQPRYCSSHAATARSATVVLTVPAPAPSALAILPHCAVDEIIDIVDGPKMITLEQVGGRGLGGHTYAGFWLRGSSCTMPGWFSVDL
jgi:hypothetical protein